MNEVDHPSRVVEFRDVLARKSGLRAIYRDAYLRYQACLSRCPKEGIALELGSGPGFVKEVIPEFTTSDLHPHPEVDLLVDATAMPFADQSLRMIAMLNVFHHIPDVARFLKEAERCLKPGGRLLIVDQHRGLISRPILRYFHYEPYKPRSVEWSFQSTGPLSGANGALSWMVFQRDRQILENLVPQLTLESYRPHTPLRYWLSGGMRNWSLLPRWSFQVARNLDRALIKLSSQLGSFVDIELVKTDPKLSSGDS